MSRNPVYLALDLPRLEAAETLGSWVTLGTVTPADGAGVFTDSAENPRRFYRIVVK